MDYFKINSKTLTRNPTDISQSKYKIQKTDRTIDGTLVSDIVAGKNRVTFTWDYLSTADLRKLLDEVNGTAYPIVEYTDPQSGTGLMSITGAAESVSYVPHYDSRNGGGIWKEVKVSFEEM